MDALQQLRGDFEVYAAACLKIRTKEGSIEPLILNKAQRYVHERLQKQLAERGYVRAMILKGRQQGMSTMVAARFYWRVSGEFGKRVGILTHMDDATSNLFEMAKRYHEHTPDEVKPSTKHNSEKELFFDRLDSGYKVATAGNRSGVGRSSTMQYFHGSEVAFWPSAADHMMGIGQTIPLAEGTEIILESTANGIGNYFHKQWQRAERGESEYEAIFVPWFWQDEYRMDKPGFVPNEEELELAKLYGLDFEQLAWRRAKIQDDFDNDPLRFQQEYPNTAAEAFVAVGVDSYIDSRDVKVARAAKVEGSGALVIGVDPSRFGKDSTAIIRRRGRLAYGIQRIKKRDTMHIVAVVAKIIDTEKPDRVFIDVGGLGAGIYDRLIELGYGKYVTSVNFGGSATEEDKYVNKRAEMWGEMNAWLKNQPAQISDDDTLHADLIGPQFKYDSLQRLQLEKKEDMRKRGVASPDVGDALALTFAYPVQPARPKKDGWHAKLAKARAANDGSSMSA